MPEPITVTAPVHPPSFRGLGAITEVDITPPVGIPMKNWGAGGNEVATAVDQPLQATALAIADSADRLPQVLVSLDHGWWRSGTDEQHFRTSVLKRLGLPPENLVISLSHTHAGPSLAVPDDDDPDGQVLRTHRQRVVESVVGACADAVDKMRPVVLDWATGWSGVAADRDLRVDGNEVCGFHPGVEADGTLLVGRLTSIDGDMLGVVVNYACHPTIMSWQNSAVSPDFVGWARTELRDRLGVPAMFLQGASGELASRHQHTSDRNACRRVGRSLALAACAALADMMPAGEALGFEGWVTSGADIASWRPRPYEPQTAVAAFAGTAALPRGDVPTVAELESRWADLPAEARRERVLRASARLEMIGGDDTIGVPFCLWRVGDMIVVAQPCEAYSWLQQELRCRFGAVVVLNLSYGFSYGYLPTATMYDRPGNYQVWQSCFAAGSLEQLADTLSTAIETHLAPSGTRSPATGGAR